MDLMNKYFITLILLVCFFNSRAQGYLEFVENKGQWANNIAYKGELNTGAIALKTDGGYRMLQHSANDLKAIREFYHPHGNDIAKKIVEPNNLGLHSHVYEVIFLGSNPTPQAIAEKPQEAYNNYFIGNDKRKWASGCKIFQAITYKNIYPNIDVRYYTGNGSLKYDFIVNPGGNPNQISLLFNGADEIKIINQKLIIKTSVTEEKELAPYTFQPSSTGKKEVDCNFHLEGNVVSFKVGSYDKTQPLIIDPIKVFATFTGSTADNWGFTATYDALGNFYAGGNVFGSGFPVSNGSTFQGGVNSDDGNIYDMGIIKFNPLGTARLYATYIGGNGNEQPQSLIVDNNGDLVILGRTNSSNYPTTLANVGACGNKDIVVSKLNSLGNIVTSRKIGGTGEDGMNIKPKYSQNPKGTLSLNRNYGDDARCDVLIDDSNNIIIGSCTQSTDFFITANAFQSTNGSATAAMIRKQDAVLMKFSNDLSNIITSTYLGGNNDDAIFSLALNPINHNIYIAGATASNNFPGDKTGVLQNSFQGGDCDGFISIFNPTTNSIIKTTYLGTSSADAVYNIKIDASGLPYILGTTLGAWQVVNAAYNIPFSKQFISKMQSNLSAYIYSTTFGTIAPYPNISPTAFGLDECENVYVTGWGGAINTDYQFLNSGTTGLPTTINAIQKITDGSDFYFFILERDAKSQLYGDFFGQLGGVGDHVDGGTSRFDNNGTLYQSICANCGGGAVFPTTIGSYSPTNGSSNCNLAAIKMAIKSDVKFNANFSMDKSAYFINSGANESLTFKAEASGCFPSIKYKVRAILPQGISHISNNAGGIANADSIVFPDLHLSSLLSDSFSISIFASSSGCAIDTVISDNREGNFIGNFSNQLISGNNNWATNSIFSKSPSQSWLAKDTTIISNTALSSSSFNRTNFSVLSFWHLFNLEKAYDGGVVELSNDNGTSWQDVGNSISQNRYDILMNPASPLSNQVAFSGDKKEAFRNTIIDLSSTANINSKLRFRLATDSINRSGTSLTGWVIDDINVTNGCGGFIRFYVYDTTNYLLDSIAVPVFIIPAALPVKFVNLEATAVDNKTALLKWKVAEQLSVKKYVIERSDDGVIYKVVGNVAANNSIYDYSFYDNTILQKNSFYRIKAEDVNGHITYSNTRLVLFNSKDNKLVITPNPASVISEIYIPIVFNATQLKIFDAVGKLIFIQEINNNQESIKINTSNFVNGTYLISVLNKQKEILSDKLIITK